MTRHRYIKPDNLPPPIGLLNPLVVYVALDYIGTPVWVTSVVVFAVVSMVAASIYVRFMGEPVDVLNQKGRS